ncbi:MAG TPA: copper chaperone PCu(A)C [Salinibacter sp.]|nr:copper chaperone PCu(A)C [Salinibacter sp.]
MLRPTPRSWVYRFFLFLGGMVLLAGCQSQSSQSDNQQQEPPSLPDNELAIENPWVEPAPSGSTSALYMTIANGRQSADTLLRVRAPIVGSSSVYAPPSDTASTLEEVSTLAIPGRARMVLQPKSTHVKLVDLGQSLDAGSTPILNLEFSQSGLQRVRVPVRTSPPNSQ